MLIFLFFFHSHVGAHICHAQQYGASGAIVILQNASITSYRMKGNRIYLLFVFFDVVQPLIFTGDPPCEFVKIPSLMVSEEYGIVLRNATSLFAYSTFQNSDLAITAYLVCSVVILSIPTYQAFMLRLILRRSRFSFCSFFQFNSRPIICALIISVIWVALAFLMQHFGANEDAQPTRQVRYQIVSSSFMWKLAISTVVLFVAVPCVARLSQYTNAQAHRRKLQVVGQKQNPCGFPGCGSHFEQASPSDGNCLFHSLSFFLSSRSIQSIHTDTSHIAIRWKVVDYLKKHCDSIFVGDSGLPLRDYVETEIKGVGFDR